VRKRSRSGTSRIWSAYDSVLLLAGTVSPRSSRSASDEGGPHTSKLLKSVILK
jgi:hypothetical protein